MARVRTIAMNPGTLLIFEGRNSLHRVSPISGPRLRHVGLLAYDTRPGTTGSELLRMSRYGQDRALRGASGAMAGFVTQIGEAFVGEGAEAAHLNTVLGERGGPVEDRVGDGTRHPAPGARGVPGGGPSRDRVQASDSVREQGAPGERVPCSGSLGVRLRRGSPSGVMRAVEEDVIERTSIDEPGPDRGGLGGAAGASTQIWSSTTTCSATRLALEAGAKRAPSLEEALGPASDAVQPVLQGPAPDGFPGPSSCR